jgi:hypothetical protein
MEETQLQALAGKWIDFRNGLRYVEGTAIQVIPGQIGEGVTLYELRMIEDDSLEGRLIGFCQLEMNENMRYQVKAVALSPDQLGGSDEGAL